MLHKSFQVLETKADGEHGEFTALVSTFGNVDHVGDRIVRGAYAKTLADWRKSGDPLPIILAHQWDDVMAHVGYANAADILETPKGLQVTGKLDVDDNPVARQVYKLMKRRTLKEFSIGYSVPAGGEHRAKDGANEITEIHLAECGPCLKGIDPKTELQAVKSALHGEKTPEALAEDAKRTAREVEEQKIPEDVPAAEQKAMSASDRGGMARRMREMADMMEMDPMPMAESEMAQRMRAMADEMGGKPKSVDTELQEVKARLAVSEKALEDLKKEQEANVTDKEPVARSVDSLRKQANAVALEVASGDLPMPPPKAAPKQPEPSLELAELKRRMRDEMLGVLSGGNIE
jgi:HK97 family phage prohead protease